MKAGTVVDIMSWIDDSVVDLAIVSRPPSSQAHKVIPILDDELVAIYPVGTRDVPSTFSPAQLSSRPMIAPERGGGTWPLIADWFDRAGLAWRPAMEVSSIEAIKSLVSTGFGYAIIPRIAAGNAEALGMAYASLHPRIHRTLTLVVRQGQTAHATVRRRHAGFHRIEGLLKSGGVSGALMPIRQSRRVPACRDLPPQSPADCRG